MGIVTERNREYIAWWRKNKVYDKVTSSNAIAFNRILQKYGEMERARRLVCWGKYTAEKIKTLYWGKMTAKEIQFFCIDNNLTINTEEEIPNFRNYRV